MAKDEGNADEKKHLDVGGGAPVPTPTAGHGDAPVEINPEEMEGMEKSAKWKYGAVMLCAFSAAVILRWISDNSSFLKVFPAVNSKCHGDHGCLGNAIVYRISFALFMFFILHLLAASPAACCFNDMQKQAVFVGLWKLKSIVFVVLCVVCLFLPAGLFTAYAYTAVGLAIIFLIMQAIIIIAFAYDLNEKWTKEGGLNDDFDGDTDSRFQRAIVCCSLLLFAFAFTWIGLMYYWFTPSTCSKSDKSMHQFLISFILCLAVLYTALSAKVEAGSIFCSGIIFAYTSWITYTAIMSGSSDSDCNRMHEDGGKMTVNSLVQILIAALTLAYTALNTAGSRSAFSLASDDGSATPKFSFVFFFVAMVMGSGYLSMVLTSWTVDKGIGGGDANPLRVDNSTTSMWAKVASSWLTILMYCQTLWAHICCGEGKLCCRDRDFNFA